MRGKAEVIGKLNEMLRNELTAINQFFVHARMLEAWGLGKLSAIEYEESREEHDHAKLLIDRILLLGGTPDLTTVGELQIGHDVKAVLEGDLAIEVRTRTSLVEAIGVAEQAHDYVSRDLLTRILDEERRHEQHLRLELALFSQLGPQSYARAQRREPSAMT